MSSVQEGFSFRRASIYGIFHVADSLTPIEYEECKEITGTHPEIFLRSQPSDSMREIIDNDTGDIVGILGVRYDETGVIIPWLLLRSTFRPPRTFIQFSRQFLQGLWKEGYDTMLVLKLASNTQQIRLLKCLGFHRNPDVVVHGTLGGELHEYIMRPNT